MEEFHKVRRLPPYVFEQVNRLKASARAGGADIIDLGMGNPDLPTPKAIVDKLCEVALGKQGLVPDTLDVNGRAVIPARAGIQDAVDATANCSKLW